jgi:hypothetical protein
VHKLLDASEVGGVDATLGEVAASTRFKRQVFVPAVSFAVARNACRSNGSVVALAWFRR